MKRSIFVLALALALSPISKGLCECAVSGAVCGDTPTWNPCCEPDKFYCNKVEGEDFGICEEKKTANKEASNTEE